jgi:type I restriction enzyme R subunit
MRPYQIVATERILNKILVSTNHDQIGTIGGGGYIWHTTGSGKTLTSFKAAQLISKEIDIDKILFVVDRKDLDYQTMQEYNKYEAGSVDGTSNTKILQRQLESNLSKKIIVTTIQKLDRFIKNNKNHVFYKKHVVLIFDECHRSQFGEFHKNIIKYFKNYHLFGFTGTPIFANNANENSKIALKTTAQVFGELLHSYTIVDAINDNNVLPFRVDYVNTTKQIPKIKDARVHAIDTNETLMSTSRITTIANYILDKFDQKTMRNKHYLLKDKRLMGFNSILATASIGAAKKYYIAFKNLQKQNTDKLKIALVYSFANNEEDLSDGALNDEIFETDKLDKSSRDFLDSAINDYNNLFTTNYSTSSDQFENYYKDVSKKIKERKIDILIVVNMFLTGLDATTLNTL